MTTSTTTQAYVAQPPQTPGKPNIHLETITYNPVQPTELLVEIAAASICHTDIKAAQGTFHMKPPFTLGHEASGIVKARGDKVSYCDVGDAVVLSYAHCQKCRFCLTGRQAYCEQLFPLNFSGSREDGTSVVVQNADSEGNVNGLFFGQSSMGRMAVVRESCAVKLPAGTSKEDLILFATLGCGIQTGAGAVMNVAKPVPGSSIVVFGAGAVGLSAIMMAKLHRPEILVLVDISQTKLNIIPKEILDGVQIVNSSGDAPGETATKIKTLTPSGRGMDFAIECTGNALVNVEAHECLDKLGTMINVGSSAGAEAKYAITKQLVQGITARGTHQGDSVAKVMVPGMIKMWRDDKFPFDKLVTRYEFEEMERLLEDVETGKVIKALLVM